MDVHLSSSARRIVYRAVLLLVPLVGLALVAPRAIAWMRHRREAPPSTVDRPPTKEEVAAARRAQEKLTRLEVQWDGGTTITPSDSAPDASGERVRWFQGFGISVESAPRGALVRVDGKDVGRTPLVTSVECTPGDEVRIEVRKPPLHPRVWTTRCRKDQLVELTFGLE
jgi:hypothetical protein